jgi:hypothetical protein
LEPPEHAISRAHERIAHTLEHAVGPMDRIRNPSRGPVAAKALIGLGAGRNGKKGDGGQSHKQRLVGHNILHEI